ncbi:mitochondrial translation release factor in rescue isoform X1 [Frankliniella occidentalis]|uniref:Mitochondrial translation release factor in rescue isoform X1 n=1 Tax=Frankliniella occidentalis TaxID=133901 RepID=A0A6J1S1S4_FRAOC|nr:mitochondrial translation release factor in rescue isoform X1 [Frankliniella occidentalis]
MFPVLKTLRSFGLPSGLRIPFLARSKFTPDTSKVPELQEEDLHEQFVRGSGPGGQSVNKSSNCVLLKHLPSGIVVRCHESRSLDQNRKIARVRLTQLLDNFINGEDSVEAQTKRENKRVSEITAAIKKERREKIRKLKESVANANDSKTKNDPHEHT